MDLLTDEKPVRHSTGNGFFIWSVVLLLMTGICFASWIGSFYVVAHPENPKCYRILKKFKRIDPPKRFPVTEAPKGEFLTAAKLLERYGKFGKLELVHENALLLRNYLTNFRESGRRVHYVAGRFQVVQSFALTRSDCFPSGAVAIAQSENLPQVLVEFVFPAAPESVATIRETVAMGADISLKRSHDLWALVHVERHADGRMQFTVVPLPYGGWQLKSGKGSFELESPEELLSDYKIELNLAAGLPIVRDPRLSAALAQHREFRRKALARAGDDQAALAGPELVRFDPEAGELASAATKAAGAAKERGDGAASKPLTTSNARQAKVARPVPTPAPAVPPPPPKPKVISKPSAPLIGAMPTPAATPAPVQNPAPVVPAPAPSVAQARPRRAISTAEASGLVEHYSAGEPAVLSGDFVVTGVLGRRVALRTLESLRDPNADPTRPGSEAALIVVEYPPDAAIPEKNATITRDAERGFVIRDVIRGRNRQITIIVNERAAE
ncbi:MAG: hypothetical protein ABI318_15880 [Chthoniobacteraceae bacterium]